MIIALLETGSKFDLPLDLKLNIEMASPIFSKAGSMSLPVSLPLTDKNRKLLQFPDHLDIYDSEEAAIRAIPDISVIVTQGSWQQVATMCISGCSDEAVEATLYFNESNIWSKLDAVTVPQTMADMHFGNIPGPFDDIEYYRTQLIAQFYDYMVPPYIYGDDLNNWLKNHDFIVAAMKTKDGWLNEPACVKRYVTGDVEDRTLHEELMTLQKTYGEDTYKMVRLKSEFEWYTTTECYGKKKPEVYDHSTSTWMVGYKNKNKHLYCTGFLRLDVVIKQIFNYLGYTLNYDFSTYWPYWPDGLEVKWNQIVVLNNTMDAIYPGYMPYSALVPEVSAKEFISAVQAQFGVVFMLQPDNKTVKMQFTEKILKLFSKTRKLGAMRDKQITFNSSPDHMPIDDMDKIKTPEYLYDSWCESLRDGYCVEGAMDPTTIDFDYGECFSFELDGVCQRTTTTRVGDTDETKTSECPLAFGVCTQMYSTDISFMEHIYNSILIDYMDVWSRESPVMEEYDQLYVNKTDYGVYRELNTEYNIIAENSDRVTITTVLKTLEANHFDFTTPYIIQGRLCWPTKLQYELENSDKQHVTIEFIAGRNL